ncbi:hypothetical protein [Microbacterium sp. 77mftsu3.1]|uniref:hypothetical protein n=1 Tax=Microbacterium sp. 77mftsu3.1 TaxID=1761802 RepID=UPI0003AA7BFF|nr:hypothetical protein [Microbacterium sp. 77mftsu3.1]
MPQSLPPIRSDYDEFPEAAAAARREPLISDWGWAFIILVVFLIGAGIWTAIDGGRDNGAGKASLACENAVRAKLKSPGSASFDSTVLTTDGKTPSGVQGTVRAENSFGAVVPSTYLCSVDPGETVRLKYVE